jgi:hypothetical protein
MSGTLTPKGVARLLEWAAGEVMVVDKQDEWLNNIGHMLMDAAMCSEMRDQKSGITMARKIRQRADFASLVAEELDEILSKKEGVKG